MVKYIRGIFVVFLAFFGIILSLGSSHAYSSKGIYYDNVSYTDNVTFYGVDGLNINYSAEMSKVGDYYLLTFDVVNDSGVDVFISDCSYHDDDPYIQYELAYLSGDKIQVGDTLEKNEVKTIQYKVTYLNPIMDDEYEVDSSFQIQFDQKI